VSDKEDVQPDRLISSMLIRLRATIILERCIRFGNCKKIKLLIAFFRHVSVWQVQKSHKQGRQATIEGIQKVNMPLQDEQKNSPEYHKLSLTSFLN
jgi:hypothetical protein